MNRVVTILRDNRKKTYAALAVLIALVAVGCTTSNTPKTSDAQTTGQQQTETAFKQQQTAVPYPVTQLTDSLERRNIRERLLRYNNPNKISYLYVLSQTGAVITQYTVKGKVTSSSSQMTTDVLVQDCSGWQTPCRNNVTAPGDDGSYGPNEDGVYFFTTEDVMVTLPGSVQYIMSDAPQDVRTPPVIVYNKNSAPTSTGHK